MIPVGLAAYWLVVLGSTLWRRRVEVEASEAIRAVAAAWGVAPRPCWNGWCVSDATRRVAWVGGLGGLQTSARVGGRKARAAGLLDADAVHRMVDDAR